MSEKYSWKRVLDELETCVKLLAVWVILKDGKMCGRITARHSKSGGTTYVVLQLFGWVAKNDNLGVVFGHERMCGWGYNRTYMGIAEILNTNREKLKEEYGIELKGEDWQIQNTWQKDFEAAGYKVISAI